MPANFASNVALSPTLRQAINASSSGDAGSAVQLLRQAALEQPTSAVPHFLLGAEFAQSGEMPDAEAAFSNAVLLAPRFDMARFQLGLVQFTCGRAAVALVTWQPLFLLDETDPLRAFVNGFAALAQDQFAQAHERFARGVELNSSNAALNADMRKVMQRIQDHVQGNRNGTDKTHESAESGAHVLLSNYRSNDPKN